MTKIVGRKTHVIRLPQFFFFFNVNFRVLIIKATTSLASYLKPKLDQIARQLSQVSVIHQLVTSLFPGKFDYYFRQLASQVPALKNFLLSYKIRQVGSHKVEIAATRLPKSPNLICAVYNRSGGLDICCEQYSDQFTFLIMR